MFTLAEIQILNVLQIAWLKVIFKLEVFPNSSNQFHMLARVEKWTHWRVLQAGS